MRQKTDRELARWHICPHNKDIFCYAKSCHCECEYLPIEFQGTQKLDDEDPDFQLIDDIQEKEIVNESDQPSERRVNNSDSDSVQ